jgi:CheY-like chemotaxis protein
MTAASHLTIARPIPHFFAHTTGDGTQPPHTHAEMLECIRAKRSRILVVDDDAVFKDSVVVKLKARYRALVETAKAGGSAVLAATTAQPPFDLILLDILLLGPMNGIDVYDEIRDAGIQTPILLISAYYDDNVRNEAALRKEQIHRKESQSLYTAIEFILLHCRGGEA